MLAMPVHPRLARLLIDAQDHGLLREGTAIAAILSEKDFLDTRSRDPKSRGSTTRGTSDLIMRLHQLDTAERARFAAYLRDDGIDPVAARQVMRTRVELLRVTGKIRAAEAAAAAPGDEHAMLRLALVAY